MPLYEYECKQCRQRLEKIQSFSAPPEKICPKCGGELERVISAPAIQFKGAGWYVNDYAKSGGKTKSKEHTGDKSEAKSDGKAETASESKLETAKASAAPAGESSSAAGSSATAPSTGGNSGSSTKTE